MSLFVDAKVVSLLARTALTAHDLPLVFTGDIVGELTTFLYGAPVDMEKLVHKGRGQQLHIHRIMLQVWVVVDLFDGIIERW